jgi:hypothetical protein
MNAQHDAVLLVANSLSENAAPIEAPLPRRSRGAHGWALVEQLPNAVIELPVMGTFVVRDGKIAAWRDYFDLNQYMSQLQGASE